jgi:hypothetical protein
MAAGDYNISQENKYTACTKTRTYTGAAGLGAIGASTLFTVTGVVALKVFAVVRTGLAGASATISVGTAANVAGLIVVTTATNMAADELWHDATPDATLELSTVSTEKIVTKDVIENILVANVTGGVVKFYAHWRPISDDGMVVAA